MFCFQALVGIAVVQFQVAEVNLCVFRLGCVPAVSSADVLDPGQSPWNCHGSRRLHAWPNCFMSRLIAGGLSNLISHLIHLLP